MVEPMDPVYRRLARHALGLRNGSKMSYRNRFWAGILTFEYGAWQNMAERGWAEVANASPGMVSFVVTRNGAAAALDPGESLCPEDFPPVAAP